VDTSVATQQACLSLIPAGARPSRIIRESRRGLESFSLSCTKIASVFPSATPHRVMLPLECERRFRHLRTWIIDNRMNWLRHQKRGNEPDMPAYDEKRRNEPEASRTISPESTPNR